MRLRPNCMSFILPLWASLSFLAGCHHHVNIAQPNLTALAPPPIEDSTLSTTTTVSVASACKQLSDMIPHPIAENPDHPCFQYGVYQHGDVKCSGAGNTLDASFQIAYKAGQRCGVAGIGQVSCGFDHEMYATAGANAMVSWDPDWHADVALTPRITLDSNCEVTVLKININGFVKDKIQPVLDNITRSAPVEIAQATDVKAKATTMWSTLNQPIAVGDSLWLMLHPKTVMAAPPNVSNDVITLSVSLTARPELIVSPNIPVPSNTSLPPLQNGPISHSFHVALVGLVSWNDATTLISKPYVGKEYSAGPFHKILIDSINVLGNGNIMVIAVKVSGNVKGTLYMQGTPTYVRSRNGKAVEEVEVPDLDFTTETQNVLASTASWVLHTSIRDELKAKAAFPLKTRLADLQTKLQTALNRQLNANVKLTGKIEDLTLRGVYLANDAVTVQAVANGTTQVVLQ